MGSVFQWPFCVIKVLSPYYLEKKCQVLTCVRDVLLYKNWIENFPWVILLPCKFIFKYSNKHDIICTKITFFSCEKHRVLQHFCSTRYLTFKTYIHTFECMYKNKKIHPIYFKYVYSKRMYVVFFKFKWMYIYVDILYVRSVNNQNNNYILDKKTFFDYLYYRTHKQTILCQIKGMLTKMNTIKKFVCLWIY